MCINKSKNVQTEHKAKARFQALLRCSRFSRHSLKLALSINFRRCKGTANKTQKPPTQWVRVGGTD